MKVLLLSYKYNTKYYKPVGNVRENPPAKKAHIKCVQFITVQTTIDYRWQPIQQKLVDYSPPPT